MYGRRDWRAADRATARHRRRPLSTFGRAVPAGHASRGLPGHERVGARLGGQLDRQLGAVGLGQRLHDGHRPGGLGQRAAVQHPRRQPALADVLDDTVRHRPVAVTQVEFLAGPDPPHVGRVEALVAVDDRQLTDLGQRVDVEERAGHAKI